MIKNALDQIFKCIVHHAADLRLTAILYYDQGKLDEAEQMYVRTLVGFRQALRDANSPSQAVISKFAAALCASIRIIDPISNIVSRWSNVTANRSPAG